MPSLRELGLDQNPSDRPLSYPGRPVPGSCLLVGDWLYPLSDTQGTNVAEWIIARDGDGPLRALRIRHCTIDGALHAADAAPIAVRTPVLAVGSNASPGQLVYKYSSWLVKPVIPISRVKVTGLAVAHSAHVSKPGYIPYVPVRSQFQREIELYALWLDTEQIQRMDQTEPNYRRLTLGTQSVIVRLESGDSLRTVTLYAGLWGALRLVSAGPPVPATTQACLFTLLSSTEWFQDLVPESIDGPQSAIAALATDASRRECVRSVMAEQRLAVSDELSV